MPLSLDYIMHPASKDRQGYLPKSGVCEDSQVPFFDQCRTLVGDGRAITIISIYQIFWIPSKLPGQLLIQCVRRSI